MSRNKTNRITSYEIAEYMIRTKALLSAAARAGSASTLLTRSFSAAAAHHAAMVKRSPVSCA